MLLPATVRDQLLNSNVLGGFSFTLQTAILIFFGTILATNLGFQLYIPDM